MYCGFWFSTSRFERIQSWHLKHRIRLESAEQSGDQHRAYLSANVDRQTMTIIYGVLSQPKHGRLVKQSLPLSLSKNILTEHYRNVDYFTQVDFQLVRIINFLCVKASICFVGGGKVVNRKLVTYHKRHLVYYVKRN